MARLKREKLKGSDVGPLRARRRRRGPQPGSKDAGRQAKAITKRGKVVRRKLRSNQRKLGVDAKHRTRAMRNRPRGTYP